MRNVLFIISILLLFSLIGCQQQYKGSKTENESKDIDDKFKFTYLIEEDTLVFYGELIYVPIYSEIYYGDAGKTIDLAITLSIHNTDLNHSLMVKSVNYHNKKGKLIRNDTLLRKKMIAIIFSSSDCIFLATKDQYLTTLRKLKHSL